MAAVKFLVVPVATPRGWEEFRKVCRARLAPDPPSVYLACTSRAPARSTPDLSRIYLLCSDQEITVWELHGGKISSRTDVTLKAVSRIGRLMHILSRITDSFVFYYCLYFNHFSAKQKTKNKNKNIQIVHKKTKMPRGGPETGTSWPPKLQCTINILKIQN